MHCRGSRRVVGEEEKCDARSSSQALAEKLRKFGDRLVRKKNMARVEAVSGGNERGALPMAAGCEGQQNL